MTISPARVVKASDGIRILQRRGRPIAYRHGDWKVVFAQMGKPGGFAVWEYFLPKLFNLRMDPYERADIILTNTTTTGSKRLFTWLADYASRGIP